MTPRLLGVAEIAAMLGLTRQRVNQLVQSTDFPEPEAELTAGRIWRRDAVEAWVAAHPERATDGDDAAMFGAFTAEARGLIIRAQEEARSLRHGYIGTEHLLLAALSDAAPDVLEGLASLGVEREDVLVDLEAKIPSGALALTGHIPFTPRSKHILTDAASRAAGPVEARHIACAIARLEDGIAADLLRSRLGVGQDELVAEVERVLGDDGLGTPFAPGASAPTAGGGTSRCSFCGQGADEVEKLIPGPGVAICDRCVELCTRIVAGATSPSPPDVAARLDELAAEIEQLRREVGGDG